MTVVTDDFNRANGGLGANYTNAIGAGFQIVGNQAVGASNEERASLRTAEAFAADQYVEFTIAVETNSFIGGLLRSSGADATRNGYAADVGFNDLIYISRYTNGVGENIVDGINVGAWEPADRFRAQIVDWTIYLYRNGTLVSSATDDLQLHPTGAPGLYGYSDGAIDNAEFGDVSTPQFARPDADITDGAWTPSTGVDLYATIDETPASDADYISTNANSTAEVGLGTLATPAAGTQTFRLRAVGSAAKKLVARVLEAGTPRATITVDPLTAAVTAYSATAAGITDYSNLTLDFAVSDATTPPSPTVTFGAIGTGANGTTTVAPSYPAGITAGQYLTCEVSSGSTGNATPTTPVGWTLLATGASTDGTFGVDTGPRRATVFGKIAVGTETGTLTVSITGGNTCRGTITRWTKSQAGYAWDVVAQGANDSTSGTGVSMTTAAISWAPGDAAMVVVGQRVDSATQSAQAITAAGITFGARTNRATTAVTTGNEIRHVVDTFAAVTAGTASVATTWAYTASAAVSAGGVVVRLREVPPTEFARVTFAEFEVPASGSGNQTLAGAAVAQASAQGTLQLLKTLAASAQAQATASGALGVGKGLAGAAAAQASAAAALQLVKTLAAAAQAQATAAGDLTVLQNISLTGDATALASAVGTLGVAKSLVGAAAAQASAAGALQLLVALNAAAQAQTTASGDLSVVQGVNLAGDAAAQAAASGALAVGKGLAAAAAGQASASGALDKLTFLAAAAAATASASGSLDKLVQLAANAAAVATASGALAKASPLAGNAAAIGTASGAIAVSVLLSGAASGVATASGALATSGSVTLAGNAQGQSSATGALQLGVTLLGAALANATATGSLDGSQALNGAAVAVATAQGGLALSVALAGAALANAQAGGTLSLMVSLSGAAAAQANAAGVLSLDVVLSGAALAQAAASGGLVLTVPLQGAASAQAQAGGSLAVGSVVDLFVVAAGQATATGALLVLSPLGLLTTVNAYRASARKRNWRAWQPQRSFAVRMDPRAWRAWQ